ncbi:cupin domain-containing protein [Mycobacteroides abscessus]|uniref:cupin domain-containing protein n=1 Tax=Mycobacteroides abscessus TaxID=36809 RepID=UPI00094CBE49
MTVRRIITSTNGHGESHIASDAEVPGTSVGAYPGTEFFLLWGTTDGHIQLVDGIKPEPVVLPFFASPGGTRFLIASFAPECEATPPTGDPRRLQTEVQERLPGLWEAFPDTASAMHRTATIDYAVCLRGEIDMELDSGDSVTLRTGDCVIQLGARHAWHNRGTEEAVMCFVGLGVEIAAPSSGPSE